MLVKDLVSNCLDLIIRKGNKEEALKYISQNNVKNSYCKGVISDLYLGRIDLSLLIITKGIGKRTEDEKSDKSKNTKCYKGKASTRRIS